MPEKIQIIVVAITSVFVSIVFSTSILTFSWMYHPCCCYGYKHICTQSLYKNTGATFNKSLSSSLSVISFNVELLCLQNCIIHISNCWLDVSSHLRLLRYVKKCFPRSHDTSTYPVSTTYFQFIFTYCKKCYLSENDGIQEPFLYTSSTVHLTCSWLNVHVSHHCSKVDQT